MENRWSTENGVDEARNGEAGEKKKEKLIRSKKKQKNES